MIFSRWLPVIIFGRWLTNLAVVLFGRWLALAVVLFGRWLPLAVLFFAGRFFSFKLGVGRGTRSAALA